MAEEIRIAELMDSFYPSIDGPTNVVAFYTKNLDARDDASCKVVVPKPAYRTHYRDHQPYDVIRCISVRSFEGYRAALPVLDPRFTRRMQKENFTLLHAHSPFVMGHLALRYGRRHGAPVVATMHTKFEQDFDRLFHGFRPLTTVAMRYIMQVFHKADSVWTVNESSRRLLREYGYEGDIVVVRNGTDLRYPDNADELVRRVNEKHHLEKQKNVMIFVGRVAYYKNLRLMAESLKMLARDGLDYKMLIIGGGFDCEEYEKEIREAGLSDYVEFVGKVSDRELLQGYYLRADLFLFPSTFDTSSLVPIEAAAHKLPVLLIRGSDTAEGIVDGVNGFLSEETPEAYAEKIKEILHDPEKRRAVGEEAFRSVYRTWEMVAEEAYAEYRRIIEKYRDEHPAS